MRVTAPEIVLLVNGEEVGRVRDQALREGTLALGVGHRADGFADARFSNLIVRRVDEGSPDGSEGATVASPFSRAMDRPGDGGAALESP